jgi:hypothetical protein
LRRRSRHIIDSLDESLDVAYGWSLGEYIPIAFAYASKFRAHVVFLYLTLILRLEKYT